MPWASKEIAFYYPAVGTLSAAVFSPAQGDDFSSVIKAVEYADRHNAVSAALMGFVGGSLAKVAKIPLVMLTNAYRRPT